MSNKIPTIYLFRHGETTFNRDAKFTGFYDSKLTKKGLKHAKTIAKRMKNKKFQVAIQTRLSRSKETLKPVLIGHLECVLIIQDDRIIERNYGALSQKSHAEIIKKYGIKKFNKWHRGFNVRPPNGESFADVEVRVRDFIKDLKKFMKKNSVSVAISAHGNSIRLFRKIMEKASIKETVSWFIPYDKIYEYKIK
ncbi:MAG: phosphoglycerate mutase family protein [archaeon]